MIHSPHTIVPIRIIVLLGVVSLCAFLLDVTVDFGNLHFKSLYSTLVSASLENDKKLQLIEDLQDELNLVSVYQRTEQSLTDELTARIEVLANEEAPAQFETLMNIKDAYVSIVSTHERNISRGLTGVSLEDKQKHWGELLLTHQFTTAREDLSVTQETLDAEYTTYLATLPTPTPKPVAVAQVSSTAGYQYQTVTTARGSFGVSLIKLAKSAYAIKTLTANDADCSDGCPAKSLSEYVSSVNGYAGMNGSYFCPPDYASCVGAVNSYDYPVFNSSAGTWRNSSALTWNNIGLAAFNGDTSTFYKSASSLGGTAVTAGISNFPTILVNGTVSFDENDTTAGQETTKGARGVLGVDASYYYLAIVNGATVTDLPEICTALGMVDALNLDGGGSSALFISGGYKVGPGRSLPNAVVLVPK